MPRLTLAILVLLAMGLAACAGTDGTAAPATSTTAGDLSTTTQADGETPTTGPGEGATTTTVLDGPAAPDFTLALGADGASSYTLSEGAKPVFMVFWAEW